LEAVVVVDFDVVVDADADDDDLVACNVDGEELPLTLTLPLSFTLPFTAPPRRRRQEAPRRGWAKPTPATSRRRGDDNKDELWSQFHLFQFHFQDMDNDNGVVKELEKAAREG
jgi:hypothetical protein